MNFVLIVEVRRNKMIKKLATLTVVKSSDFKNTVVRALEEAGFIVVQEQDGFIEDIYIIAEKQKENK